MHVFKNISYLQTLVSQNQKFNQLIFFFFLTHYLSILMSYAIVDNYVVLTSTSIKFMFEICHIFFIEYNKLKLSQFFS